jgi:hypothetical protein
MCPPPRQLGPNLRPLLRLPERLAAALLEAFQQRAVLPLQAVERLLAGGQPRLGCNQTMSHRIRIQQRDTRRLAETTRTVGNGSMQ